MVYRSLTTVFMVCCVMNATVSGGNSPDSIPFTDAVHAAVENHPRLQVVTPAVAAREAETGLAGMWENPQAGVEVAGVNEGDIEFRLSQKIPLGGKTKARAAIAGHECDRERKNGAVIRREIELGLVERFIPVVVYEDRCRITDSLLTLTEALAAEIRRRVENGAARPADTIRIRIECDRITMERDELRAMAQSSRNVFAQYGADTMLLRTGGRPNLSLTLPPFDSLAAMIDSRPDRKNALESLVGFDLEDALILRERCPDIVAEAGFVRGRDGGGNDPLIALSLDLPLRRSINLKRRTVASNRQLMQVTLDEEKRASVGDLKELYARFAVLEKRRQTIVTKINPGNGALTAVLEEYYRAGNGSLMEVIEARREQTNGALAMMDSYEEQARCALGVMRTSGCTIDIITDRE